MFGLDAFLYPPPLSILVSVLLILGFDKLGLFVLHVVDIVQYRLQWARWQAPVLGAMLSALIMYPLALAGLADFVLLQILALLLVLTGAFHFVLSFKAGEVANAIATVKNLFHTSMMGKLLCMLFLAYLMLALGPITNADSVDYHVGVALRILESGAMPATPEWFHSRLAGSGEVLNALGFAMGAEQAGAMLQLMGMFSVTGLLLYGMSPPNQEHLEDWRLFLAIAALSSPVLIFLTSSVKPQLLPVAFTTLALFLALYLVDHRLPKNTRLKIFSVIVLLTLSAAMMKFSYFLGGGIAGILALFVMKKTNQLIPAIIVGVAGFCVTMLPAMLWKMHYFNGGLVGTLLTPLPGGWPGTEAFETMLRNYSGVDTPFPLSLVLPTSLGTLTTVIGFGVFLPLLLKPREDQKVFLGLVATIVVTIFLVLLSPPNSRSYLEVYFWSLMVLSFQAPPALFILHRRFFHIPLILQSAAVLGMCCFGIVNFLPGMVSEQGRNRVMTSMANGYSLVQWLDDVLPAEAVILSAHRSVGLWPRKSVSLDWSKYTAISHPDALVYLYRIREEGVSHLLITGKTLEQSEHLQFFSGCLPGGVIGPQETFVATRNPFNRSSTFNAWLLPLDSSGLPDCLQAGLTKPTLVQERTLRK